MQLPEPDCISLLGVLQLSDSGLPIGSLSHSFGLETLVSDGDIEEDAQRCSLSLARYLDDSLSESMLVDAVFCREAHSRAARGASVDELNLRLGALRPARESREASLIMGRRFAALAAALHRGPALSALASLEELHHSVAFGYTLGVLGIGADLAVSAFLHQSVLHAISAAQRLLPLGQTQANLVAWGLKPAILETVERSRGISFSSVGSAAYLPELASMRHPGLPTRLFIS
jgi:urease accessory protein